MQTWSYDRDKKVMRKAKKDKETRTGTYLIIFTQIILTEYSGTGDIGTADGRQSFADTILKRAKLHRIYCDFLRPFSIIASV